MTRFVLVLVLVLVLGCSSHPPCEPEGVALITTATEPANAKLVHLVTFEMGPFVETMTGYLILRAPDRLRLYGMTETGQRAFDVAWHGSPTGEGKVVRIYRAPFLKDDHVLDEIARASARVFLLRPTRASNEPEHEESGVTFAQHGVALRWLQGKRYWACFQEWTDDFAVLAPRRVHFHSDEGPYPYDLRMKLLKAEKLATRPADSIFEPK
jgi:hypothetical protein